MSSSILERFNIFKKWRGRENNPSTDSIADIFKAKYERFKELLDSNADLSRIIADIEAKLQGREIFGMSYVRSQSARAAFYTLRMVQSLDALSSQKYSKLLGVFDSINEKVKESLGQKKESPVSEWILPYSRIDKEKVDWVGGKNANLGEVLNGVHLPIPDGFAITTLAFDYFLSENDLVDEINKRKMELSPKEPESINEVSEEIQRLIISAPVPEPLSQAILGAYDEMVERLKERGFCGPSVQVSMRSSAIGEDSELSYAGQYLSMLNISRENLCRTYNYIIASLYTPRAISYRLSKGIRDEDIAMSVACLQMVEAVSSGVAYSRHPFNLLEERVIISAVYGLGPYAVDGVITPDTYAVEKDGARTIFEMRASNKPVQLASNPEGGLIEIPVPQERQNIACLTEEQIKLLAGYAIELEKHYGCAQDMEWALDCEERLIVLQTRPLKLDTAPAAGAADKITPKLTGYRLLVENGAVAFPGVGFGPAWQVRSEDDLSNFPDGAVLVAAHSSPKFVIVMEKARAIIADSGSVTGHMASLVREFGVPTVLDAKSAMASIPTGMEVTVDAYSGRVYEGRAKELLSFQKSRESHMQGTPVYETLKQVASSIVPLHLFDPRSPDFTPENCRSFHDIMRLIHEFSYAEMFQISDLVSNGSGYAVKLQAPVPLDLYVIDLGGGILEEARGRKKVGRDQIASVPFQALLKGMTHEELRYHRPRPIELKGFFSVMGEQMLSSSQTAERFGDRSYAIISDKYLNFSSRVGYHYGILDSYCGLTSSKNYITFSFKGGAADDIRRNRRARAIALILKELGFSVETIADRVDARLQKYEASVIKEKLDIVGRLLIFTRQMDMLMNSEESVETMAGHFLSGNYHLD